jgi:hypothetical protein
MKTNVNFKLLFLATILVVSSVSAMAQARHPGKPGQGQKVQRQNQDASDKLMVKAARECNAAARIMRTALPIYHGHRIAAINLSEMAVLEIKLGLRGERNGAAKTSMGNQSENGGNFTDEQIRRSNAKMQKASEILLQAKGDLQSANKEYNGHRANAIGDIERALNEIQLALASVNKTP